MLYERLLVPFRSGVKRRDSDILVKFPLIGDSVVGLFLESGFLPCEGRHF